MIVMAAPEYRRPLSETRGVIYLPRPESPFVVAIARARASARMRALKRDGKLWRRDVARLACVRYAEADYRARLCVDGFARRPMIAWRRQSSRASRSAMPPRLLGCNVWRRPSSKLPVRSESRNAEKYSLPCRVLARPATARISSRWRNAAQSSHVRRRSLWYGEAPEISAICAHMSASSSMAPRGMAARLRIGPFSAF